MIHSMRRVSRSVGGVSVVLALLGWLASPAWGQRFVFVSNDGTSQPSVSVFAVGAGGGLSAVSGSPFGTGATGAGADAIVLTPDGAHLYVANFSGSVSGFSVGASGTLTPVPGSPWAAGTQLVGLAITPDGRYLYATNSGSGTVSGYAVGTNGVLTPLPVTSLGVGQTGPGFPAITPNGDFLYVPDAQGVVAFAIGANGSLSAAPGSPYALPGGLSGPAAGVTPSGRELFVGMGYSVGTVAAYAIAANGALTAVPGSPFTAASGLSSIPDIAVSPTGAGLYATDGSSLAGMSIAADGPLTEVPGSPFSFPDAASQPQAIAVAPGGGEVFADNPANSVLQPYAVQSNGALAAIGSPVSTGDAAPDQGGITVGPDRGPSASFLAGAEPARSPSSFDASRSTAPDGTVVSYAWSFGDGTSATGSAPTTAHVYAAPGTYTVTLTVTGSDGCSTTGPFTGQSPSCTLDPAATTSETITIPAATLSNLRVSPRRFSLAGRKVKGRCVKPTKSNGRNKRCRRPIRLRVSYTLNASAVVTITLKRQAPGRKVNGRCVKPTKKNSKHRKCMRLLGVPGKITLADKHGSDHFTFNGKIGRHKLGPGTYQLLATPTGGKPKKVTFRIVS
jgi:DNA-binding beta-propeller fold protein YncE